jgi:hypothetical protein
VFLVGSEDASHQAAIFLQVVPLESILLSIYFSYFFYLSINILPCLKKSIYSPFLIFYRSLFIIFIDFIGGKSQKNKAGIEKKISA